MTSKTHPAPTHEALLGMVQRHTQPETPGETLGPSDSVEALGEMENIKKVVRQDPNLERVLHGWARIG